MICRDNRFDTILFYREYGIYDHSGGNDVPSPRGHVVNCQTIAASKTWVPPPSPLPTPQASDDGQTLIIVNMATGVLYKVDATTGRATPIDLGDSTVTSGDGLVSSSKVEPEGWRRRPVGYVGAVHLVFGKNVVLKRGCRSSATEYRSAYRYKGSRKVHQRIEGFRECDRWRSTCCM